MFSILTTTYNSELLIHRVYDSLLAQTYSDFEWIVIDDASTDNTEQLIKSWQEISDFDIVYHKMPFNQGKAPGINKGIELCTRPITINADADDTFNQNTLIDLKNIWEAINSGQNSNKIGAVWTLTQDESGNLIGEEWPKDFWQVSFKERVLSRKKNIEGEKWHSWRTEVLKEYKKFTNPNSRISPEVSWNRINKDYDFLCVNTIHRTYFLNPTGISHQKKSKLKVMKRIYYSGFYELNTASLQDIISAPYYRNYAFSYIRASIVYKDKTTRLKGGKLVLSWLIFILDLPIKLIKKI